jgi:uncharacterized protein
MPAYGKTVMAASVNMKVTELWRYPVKSMAGEMLERAQLGPLGIEGDRVVHVEDSDGRVVTSRSHPRFLGHRGVPGPNGEPLVDGNPWNATEETTAIVDVAGPGARLVRYDGVERPDVVPLLVATDGAIAASGHDRRRLRPNIVAGGEEGLSEQEWPEAYLHIGKVVIGIQDLRLEPATSHGDRTGAEIGELHGKRFTIEETSCDQMKPAIFEPLLARLGEILPAQRVLREIFGLR